MYYVSFSFSDLIEHIRTVHPSELTRNKVNIHRCTFCSMKFYIKQQPCAHELPVHKLAHAYILVKIVVNI